MKNINVLSWGGGTQSTALMIMLLEESYPLDYIIFSDTGDESEMTYDQIYKITEYVKNNYQKDIIITKRSNYKKSDDQIIQLVQSKQLNGSSYRSSEFKDLYQNQLLFYMGFLDKADIVPHWVINKHGEIGKLMGRQCTVEYKINAILRELRKRESIKRFDSKKHKINMLIGFTIDEISRLKPSPSSYIKNLFPLVDRNLSKIDCIEYIKEKLGFTPRSSVCNMCYANDFNTIYNLYKNDSKAWQKLLDLDHAMSNKPSNHRIKGDVYMFHWQIKMKKRLKDIDMESLFKERNKYYQLSIFDIEQEMSCMGGCFI